MPELVSAKELAIRLGIKADTVHAWCRRGWIPSLRAGKNTIRFNVAKVLEALEARDATKGVKRHDG